ncbi:MAG: hypothetical protein WD534_11070 [Phycisphaeraceae bacterium]
MKKVFGIILTVLGGLMLLGSIVNAFTLYDLSDGHDLSTFLGGFAISALIGVGGLALLQKKKPTGRAD